MAEPQQAQTGQLDNKRLKLQPSIGAFIGLVWGNKIGLRQRTENEKASITGKVYTGQYELPGGAADPVGDKKTDYWYVFREALRELQEETGIDLDISEPMDVSGLPLFFNAPAGPDLAIVYPFPTFDMAGDQGIEEAIAVGKIRWVGFDELQTMAQDGKIVGGRGKRHHIMALYSLATEAENDDVRSAAQGAINEIGGR